jgi:transposase InsO family protein
MKAAVCSNFRELCQDYGISTKTGYKWKARFVQNGLAGMEDQSRRPHTHAKELSEAVVCEIVNLKQAHPNWGPRKIRALYERKHPGKAPSESSFKRILEAAGLTKPRKRRRAKQSGRLATGRKASACNEVWTVDFKGWWNDPEGSKVEPLTVRDEYSKMILELRKVANSRTETIRSYFEQLFEKHGLPSAIRSDNGPPFASSNGLLGLSRLSAWWLALGIDLERGRPGCPQDNGAHERMHLDISRELEVNRLGRDQEAFDVWRHEFNTVRPHEILGMATPAELYEPSGRSYEGTPEDLDYGTMETRRIKPRSGTICYQGEPIMISTALVGWSVGLASQNNGLLEVWFADLLLGHLDPATSSFKPSDALPPCATTAPSAASATLRRPKERRKPQQPVQTPEKL